VASAELGSGVRSAKTKLIRAAKHIKALQRSIAKYAASHPYKITKSKSKGTERLTIPKSPPAEISVIAGEVLYQIRSALDHLAFNLVQRNPGGITLPKNWFKRVEFPLYLEAPKESSSPSIPNSLPVPQKAFDRMLPGISKEAFAFIERAQPYYGKGEPNSALGYLAELSNIDKHRYLNVIGSRVRGRQTIRYKNGFVSSSIQALDRNTELSLDTGMDESDHPVYVYRRFRAFVTFQERGIFIHDATTLPADYLLGFILEQIKTFVVPELVKFIEGT